MDRKQFFVDELKKLYQKTIATARTAELNAEQAADEIRQQAHSKDDSTSAVEPSRLAIGHRMRRERAVRELETLIEFASGGIPAFGRNARVALGAMVDVSIHSDEGGEERTLLVLPVGAGNELSGPGGDGFLSVITPHSPLGKALQGARAGDEIDVLIDGRDVEWTVIDVC